MDSQCKGCANAGKRYCEHVLAGCVMSSSQEKQNESEQREKWTSEDSEVACKREDCTGGHKMYIKDGQWIKCQVIHVERSCKRERLKKSRNDKSNGWSQEIKPHTHME